MSQHGRRWRRNCRGAAKSLLEIPVIQWNLLILAVPVNIKPRIIDSVVEHTISIGGEIELPCAASGHPLPIYQWTKDSQAVALSDRITLRGGNLVISNAMLDDGGSYQCTAENSLGSNTVSRNLIVRGEWVWQSYFTSALDPLIRGRTPWVPRNGVVYMADITTLSYIEKPTM